MIGVISDTHGLMRPEALDALEGSELILHAGDVGSIEVLRALEKIAPVVAVRGNVDHEAWTTRLRMSEWVEHAGLSIYMRHILEEVEIDPVAAGVSAIITGHTHRPETETRNGVLYLNPGSAGPRRFDLPVSVALLEAKANGFEARIMRLG